MRANVDIDDKLLKEAKKTHTCKDKEGVDKSLFEGAYKKKTARTPYQSLWNITH